MLIASLSLWERFGIRHVLQAALCGMTEGLVLEYGELPLIYAGGVMSNSLLRRELEKRYGGHFAPPAYSADNAVGIAWLCGYQLGWR